MILDFRIFMIIMILICHLQKLSQRLPDAVTRNSVGNSSHLMAPRSPKSCDSNSQSCPIPGTTLRCKFTQTILFEINGSHLHNPFQFDSYFNGKLCLIFKNICQFSRVSWILNVLSFILMIHQNLPKVTEIFCQEQASFEE